MITVDDNTISQSDDDSTVTLTLTFSSPMDQSVTPSIAFSPDVESSGILTFDNINSGWLSSTVYVAKYIIDATIPAELQNIIATISNAQDLASNPISPSVSSSLFDVDTIAPTVSISSPSVTSTTTGPVTYTVTYSGANTVNLVNSDIVLNTTGTVTGVIGITNGNTVTPIITISNITLAFIEL